MEARSARQLIADLQTIADSALVQHEILEDVEINEREGYWVIGRPNSSAYRTQISVLKFGVLHAHGDAGMAMWEHFYSDDMARLNVLGWMAKRPTWDSYMAEKAVLAMGRDAVYDHEDDVAFWEVGQRLKDLGDPLDASERGQREIVMWTEVRRMIEEGDLTLAEIDRYIYDTTGDAELCGIGRTLRGNIIWSHFLVRKLWELLREGGIVD
jgi:hypothetical protein